MGRPTWAPEHLAMLKEHWPTKSSGEIAAMLGKSRGAVMGMKRRLGLEAKIPSGNRHGHGPRVRKPEPQYLPVSLMEARPNQCRAVLDGLKDKDGLAMVCGKPIVWGQPFSFCSKHLAEYTTKGGYRVRSEPLTK